jgi:hypothetical protein
LSKVIVRQATTFEREADEIERHTVNSDADRDIRCVNVIWEALSHDAHSGATGLDCRAGAGSC